MKKQLMKIIYDNIIYTYIPNTRIKNKDLTNQTKKYITEKYHDEKKPNIYIKKVAEIARYFQGQIDIAEKFVAENINLSTLYLISELKALQL